MEIAFSVAVERLSKDKKRLSKNEKRVSKGRKQVSKLTEVLLLVQKLGSKSKFLLSTIVEAIIL